MYFMGPSVYKDRTAAARIDTLQKIVYR